MNEKINTLKISFANEIASDEVPLFRGAIVHAVGEKGNLLFHNHEGDGFRYAYPLKYNFLRKQPNKNELF